MNDNSPANVGLNAYIPDRQIIVPAKRIVELDILRGLAIFGVLVVHSRFTGRFTTETIAVQAVMARMFDWAVLAFFFSSGSLYDSSVPFIIVLKKRTASLLVPFCLYCALYNLYFVGAEAMGWVHSNMHDNSNLLATGPFRLIIFQLYFLPYLFLISLFVCGLDKLNHRLHGLGYLFLLLMVAAFYLDRGYPDKSYGQACGNLPLYLASYLIGIITRPLWAKEFARTWVTVVVLGMMLGILVLFQGHEVSIFVPPVIAGAAGVMVALPQSKILISMGEMSGSIYLWHTPVMLPAITRLLAYCGIPSLLNLCLSIPLTMGVCILLRLGLDHFFVRVTKRRTPRYITL
jgi:peptidoglycan/LPS O-acetylase OafA/YrhL